MARGAAVHPTAAQRPRKKAVAVAASQEREEQKLASLRPSEHADPASESDDSDSDYNVEEDARGSDPDEADELLGGEADRAEFHRLLQAELDECADDGPDFYLKQMLAERDGLEGDDAAFVERYVRAQQEWKDRHNYSIDAFDLDVQVKPCRWKKVAKKVLLKKKPRRVRRQAPTHASDLLWRAWRTRVAPRLPRSLRDETPESVASVVGAALFVAIALGVQWYYALRAPRNAAVSN